MSHLKEWRKQQMDEFEQIFVMMECKLCGLEKDGWGNIQIKERRFVSNANDPNKFICTNNCGFMMRLTEEERERVISGLGLKSMFQLKSGDKTKWMD